MYEKLLIEKMYLYLKCWNNNLGKYLKYMKLKKFKAKVSIDFFLTINEYSMIHSTHLFIMSKIT